MMQSVPADLLVIGGGVNGTGIARDAAGRGLKVVLAERGDLAGATSSAATKLIHGGLRYLEQYEFRLVREALGEREVLMRMAPHIIWPLRFVLPHHPGLRPAWMIRIGLFLYDHLSSRQTLPGSIGVNLIGDIRGKPLKPEFKRGFEYSDCWVDDARLVALNAMSARQLGARVLTRTAVTAAKREGELWRATLTDQVSGRTEEVLARGIVNAAGPWVRETLTGAFGANPKNSIRLIKGSHIVTQKLFEGEHCYIFQNADGRIIFAIPYERDFTLVGTTDVALDRLDAQPRISEEETEYLLAAASEYFRTPLTRDMIVWSYAGVRPLYDDGENNPSSITRDYVLDLDGKPGDKQAPLLSVYGGKLTTYRRLSEHAMEKIATFYPNMGKAWSGTKPLPGGDFGGLSFADYLTQVMQRYPQLDRAWLVRFLRRHGSNVHAILGDAKTMADMGEHFGGGLYAREVDWLMREEWAREADDVLWRRTKCGLWISAADRERLANWMAQHRSNGAAA